MGIILWIIGGVAIVFGVLSGTMWIAIGGIAIVACGQLTET